MTVVAVYFFCSLWLDGNNKLTIRVKHIQFDLMDVIPLCFK
jgi:hypothetical protein